MKILNYIILFIVIILISCSDDKVVDSNTPKSQYSGVSEYDSLSNKIMQVDNDWEPECYEVVSFGKHHFCFYSTYPLPAIDTLTLWIGSAINGNFNIWLALNDSTVTLPILNEVKQVGDFELKIPFDDNKLHRNLVYRLFVESTDFETNQTQIHFGDVIWK
jgi:hypothetical protein